MLVDQGQHRPLIETHVRVIIGVRSLEYSDRKKPEDYGARSGWQYISHAGSVRLINILPQHTAGSGTLLGFAQPWCVDHKPCPFFSQSHTEGGVSDRYATILSNR